MQQKLFSIYDKKTNCYERPFIARHSAEVAREWPKVISNPETKYGKNPTDFSVFEIGSYDDETGIMENIKPFIQVTPDEL